MHGNVWEWCEDNWHADYNGAPEDGSVWPGGDASLRVLRGGSWGNYPRYLRLPRVVPARQQNSPSASDSTRYAFPVCCKSQLV
jgi:formylglycine-generating enzyme required for sulfatase activity